jgi:ELWxxDGT repeat protein
MIPSGLSNRLRVAAAVISSALALMAVVPGPVLATTTNPYLVKNINPNGSSNPQELTEAGGKLFFTANDGVHDRELWVSDGTSAGTHMVKDILPISPTGYAPYWPGALTAVGGLVYFSATDGVHGYEPWISDGTEAGTHMIKDVSTTAGVFGSDPYGYTDLNGVVYFSAWTQLNGREMWRTDGTEAGTRIVADVTLGTAGSYPEYFTAFKNRIYYVRHDATNSNRGTLFRTDGTAAGTKAVRDKNGYKIRGIFNYGILHVVGEHLFIGRNTKQVWVSGGTPASTMKLVDFGTRTVAGAGGVAYLTWEDGGAIAPPSFLWRSDGTTAGTQPLYYFDGTPIVAGFVNPLGSNLIFWGTDTWDGETRPTGGLSVSDGTNAGTVPLGVYALPVDYVPSSNETPRATLNSVLYFPAQTYDGLGNFSDVALWRTDGTGAGTYAVSPGYASGILSGATAAANKIFFATRAGKGTELYAYVP